jgi:hypothetical protein
MNRRLLLGLVVIAGLAVLAVAGAAPSPPSPQPVTAKLSKRIKFDGVTDAKTTLGDILDWLAKQNDLTFDVNDKAFKFENAADVLKTDLTSVRPMRNVRLDTVLRKVLGQVAVGSGATYILREDVIEVTTNTFLTTEVWGDFNGPHLPLVWATLDKAPLEDALKELAEQADFNVMLDNRAGEKGKTPVTARLRNTPLDTAVRLLADMADLRPVQLDNVLYVTTKENAAAMDARLEKEKNPGGPTDEDKGPRFRKGSGRNLTINAAPMGALQ